MLKFLHKALRQEPSDLHEASLADVIRDLRSQERYMIQEYDQKLLAIIIDGQRLSIRNISYGGACVEVPQGWKLPPPKKEIKAILQVLSDETDIRTSLRHNMNHAAGFRFHHDDASALLFLRRFIESIRHGASFRLLDPQHVKEHYKKEGWTTYRGEGPTDLLIRDSGDHFLLTLRQGERYAQVEYHQGKIYTGVAIDLEGVGVRMNRTHEVDMDILKSCIFVLMGIKLPSLETHLASIIRAMVELYHTDAKIAEHLNP